MLKLVLSLFVIAIVFFVAGTIVFTVVAGLSGMTRLVVGLLAKL